MSASLAPELRTEFTTLARLSFPIALAQLGTVAMGLVDTAMLGRISTHELAGAAIGRSLLFAMTAIPIGISGALEPLASQAVGASEPGRAFSALVAGVRAIALTTPIALAFAFAVTFALPYFGIESALVPVIRANMLGGALGVPAFALFLAAKSFLQAHGRTRPALVAMVVANVVNVVACVLLVLGDEGLAAVHLPRLGLRSLGALGAGLATSVAYAVLAAVMLAAALRLRGPVPGEPVRVREVLRLSLPMGLQLLAEIGVFSLAALFAGRLGADVVSAHQVAMGLASFTFMGGLGVASGTAVRVGQAVGAGSSPRRAGVAGILMGTMVMCSGAFVFTVAPEPLVRLFTNDEGVVAVGTSLLRIAAFFQLFDGMQVVAAGALRGAGDVRFPFVATIAAHWLLGLPLSLGLGFGLGFGARGLWWGLTAGLVSIALILTARFLRITQTRIERL